MLNEKERADFLALLLAFCAATGTSGRDCAAIFNINPNTFCRWIRAARGNAEVHRLYWHRARPVTDGINALNAFNAAKGGTPYHSFKSTAKHADRRELIASLLLKLNAKK